MRTKAIRKRGKRTFKRRQFWQPGQPVQRDGLKRILEEYRWDFIAEAQFNGILTTEWQLRFDSAITSRMLFPTGVRRKAEAVGWIPILTDSRDGKRVMHFLLALPPSSRRKTPETYEILTNVLRQAVRGLFCRPKVKLRPACASRLNKVLTNTVRPPEFVETYARSHHRKPGAAEPHDSAMLGSLTAANTLLTAPVPPVFVGASLEPPVAVGRSTPQEASLPLAEPLTPPCVREPNHQTAIATGVRKLRTARRTKGHQLPIRALTAG